LADLTIYQQLSAVVNAPRALP